MRSAIPTSKLEKEDKGVFKEMKYSRNTNWGWYKLESQDKDLWLYEYWLNENPYDRAIIKEILRTPEGLEIVDEADLLADNGKKAERIIDCGSVVKMIATPYAESIKQKGLHMEEEEQSISEDD